VRTGEKVKTKEYPRRTPKRIAIPAPDIFQPQKTEVPQRVEVEIVAPERYIQSTPK
jgi:hypothetical protein